MTDERQERSSGQEPNENEEEQELDLETELPKDKDTFTREEMEKVRREAARNRVKAREAESLWSQYGGREAAEALLSATRSTEGLTRLFIESGQAIGLDRNQVVSLLNGGTGAGLTPPEMGKEDDEEADKPLTRRQLQELMTEFEQRLKQPIEQQRTEDLTRAGTAIVFETLEKEGITDHKDQVRAMKFIEDHAPEAGAPDEFDAGRIRQAVRDGVKDYRDWQEEVGRAYLERKEKGTEAPAAATGSGAASMKIPNEPKNVAEAIAMADELLSQES